MICPKCGAEYRAGFSMCADCHIPLVFNDGRLLENSSGTEQEGDDSLVQVLESAAPSFVADDLTAIERAQIPYILESGTAFESAHRIAGRKPYPEWRAYLYIHADFKEEFAKILIRVKSQSSTGKNDVTGEQD